jgi:hypothetical protein
MSAGHPLDRAVWNALTTRQAHLAIAEGGVKRFDPKHALFAAAVELLPRLWTGERLVRALGVSCTGLIAGSGELFALKRA